MKPITIFIAALVTLSLTTIALIFSFSTNPASADGSGNSFSISMSNGMSFDQNSEDAKVLGASAEYLQLSGDFGYSFPSIVLEARGLDDEPVTRTTDISEGGYGDRHFRAYFSADIDGQRKRLVCQSALVGSGWVERSELTETRVSGSFSIEIVECFEFYSGTNAPVAYDGLPFTVSGEFSLEVCGAIMANKC